jgi:hypothetical protein
VNGASLDVVVTRLSASQCRVPVTGRGAHAVAFVNPVTVQVTIGDDTGVALVQAQPFSSK